MRALALLPDELAAIVPGTNARHVFGLLQRPWLWRDGAPDLKPPLRQALDIALPTIDQRLIAADRSVKLALRYSDGQRVEVVHMPRAVGAGRVTLCVSSQVGCGMGCTFCATALMGLVRQL